MDRAGLRRKLLKAQAEAGDIVLLFGDESEALTHPYLAHAWAKRGADLRVPARGQAAEATGQLSQVPSAGVGQLPAQPPHHHLGGDVLELKG